MQNKNTPVIVAKAEHRERCSGAAAEQSVRFLSVTAAARAGGSP